MAYNTPMMVMAIVQLYVENIASKLTKYSSDKFAYLGFQSANG
jgi:hypothetical protein